MHYEKTVADKRDLVTIGGNTYNRIDFEGFKLLPPYMQTLPKGAYIAENPKDKKTYVYLPMVFNPDTASRSMEGSTRNTHHEE